MSVMKVLRLEKKYERPLAQILKDFVAAGYTIRAIAKELYISNVLVSQLLGELGIRQDVATVRHTPKQCGEHNTKYRAEFNGRIASVSAHCGDYGLCKSTVYNYMHRDGMSPEQALQRAAQGR